MTPIPFGAKTLRRFARCLSSNAGGPNCANVLIHFDFPSRILRIHTALNMPHKAADAWS